MHRLAIRPLANARFAQAAPSLPRPSRFLSTAPPHRKSRSWKSSITRWGLAGAIVYYYNTSDFFADDPQYVTRPVVEPLRAIAQQPNTKISDAEPTRRRDENDENASSTALATAEEQPLPGSPEQLEAEAGQQGAFNEETGEINWDCPCLGGMAYGPCGEQFRAAFSCFVFSKEDPKGIECIDHFKTMQNCFREHPDIYGSELEEDEVADAIDGETPPSSAPVQGGKESSGEHSSGGGSDERNDAKNGEQSDANTARARAHAATEQVAKDFKAGDDKDDLVPRAAHDAR